MRVGVFGHVGNQNLGDEALVAAVLQNVRRRFPTAELCAFTGRPGDTSQRHQVTAFPIRRGASRATKTGDRRPTPEQLSPPAWRRFLSRRRRLTGLLGTILACVHTVVAIPHELIFLAQSFRRLRGMDLLLVAGSAQLSDYWGGPWGFPFTLWKWSLLARLTGTRFALLSVGAGPLRTPTGRFFVKQTVRLAHYRSYRDEDSRQCVLRLGVPGDHPVVPDLVFSLHRHPAPMARIRERARVVGINAMPVGDDQYWPERDPVGYCRYLDTMASLGDWLLDRGYVVRFFPTQLLVDGGVIEQIRQRMRSPAPTERVGSIDELVAAVDGFDFAVATRYHGIVFSLTRLKPVLGIAYQPKSIEVMRQVGLGEYALEMGQLSLQGLQDRFALLERNCGPIAENLRQRLPYLRRELDAQYDRVLVQRSAEVFNAGITPVSRALRLPSRDMENMV